MIHPLPRILLSGQAQDLIRSWYLLSTTFNEETLACSAPPPSGHCCTTLQKCPLKGLKLQEISELLCPLVSGLRKLVATVLEVKKQMRTGEENIQALSEAKLALNHHPLTNSHVRKRVLNLYFMDSVFHLLCKNKG